MRAGVERSVQEPSGAGMSRGERAGVEESVQESRSACRRRSERAGVAKKTLNQWPFSGPPFPTFDFFPNFLYNSYIFIHEVFEP